MPLYVPHQRSNFRLLGGPHLKFHDCYGSFIGAVRAGQKVFGFANFHVEAPEDYIPTREEQLLIVTRNRKEILDSI